MIPGYSIALMAESGDAPNLLSNSIRLRADGNNYFSRSTIDSGKNKWTLSLWVKRATLGSVQTIISSTSSAGTNNFTRIEFDASDRLVFNQYVATVANGQLVTNKVFRDPSAWYNIIVYYDDANATSTERVKIWCNGEQITSFSTANYPTLSVGSYIGAGYTLALGQSQYTGQLNYFDGYVSEVILYSNQLPGVSTFGEFSVNTNEWEPVAPATFPGADPFYEQVKLLLHFDGSNGSTTFTDSSTVNNSFTVYAPAQISTAYSKFGGSSGYFGNNYACLYSSNYTMFNIGSSNFTIEMWLNPYSINANGNSNLIGHNDYLQYMPIDMRVDTSNNVIVRVISTNYTLGTLTTGVWQHVAVVREGGNLYGFINGVKTTLSTSLGTTALTNSFSQPVLFGGRYGSARSFLGYIDELRYTVGVARYTSDFTVPTSASTSAVGQGANGFRLSFTDSTSLGKDFSGANNNFTPVSLNNSLTYKVSTSLLFDFDGTYGSSSFTDRGDFAHTVSKVGTPIIDGSLSKLGKASLYLDGNSYISVPSSNDLIMGSSDFTYEAWFKAAEVSGNYLMGDNQVYFILFGSGQIGARAVNAAGSVSVNLPTGAFLAAGYYTQWRHVAFTREGNVYRLFVDGNMLNSSTVSGSLYATPGIFSIGSQGANAVTKFKGWVDGVRVIKGKAVYTSNFVPPVTSIVASDDPYYFSTSLLVQSNSGSIIDSSISPKTLTLNGGVALSNLKGKFRNSSIYFDGAGDYIQTPAHADFNMGAGSFTVEAWVCPTSSSYGVIVGQADNAGTNSSSSFSLRLNGTGKIYGLCTSGSTLILETTGATTVPLNTWSHIAYVRNGNTAKVYLNGVVDGTSATSYLPVNSSAYKLGIGCAGEYTASLQFTGFIDDVRITKGIARYPSSFTPKQVSVDDYTITPVLGDEYYANVALHLHTEGLSGSASILDSSLLSNNITANGGAQLSNTQSKFGSTSLYLNGTNASLTIPSAALTFGTSSFTIEAWIYPTSIAIASRIFYGMNGATDELQLVLNTNGTLGFETNNGVATSSGGSVSLNQWNHVALVRNGTAVTAYLNGVSVATGTDAGDITVNTYPSIGKYRDNQLYFQGYIDEVRITKNIARYTTTFTPSTTAFFDSWDKSTKDNTVLMLHADGVNGSTTIIDSSTYGKTVSVSGNTQLSTSIKKYGSSSIYIQKGSNNHITVASNTDFYYPAYTDFTWECWIYPTNWADENTVLLLHGNGTNGSTTITDSCSTPKAVTANGNAQISTSQIKFGSASIYFDGTDDYLSIPESPDFDATQDFTIETWVYPTSLGVVGNTVFFLGQNANAGSGKFALQLTAAGGIQLSKVDGHFYSASSLISVNNWYHIAVSRSSGVLKVFLNGTAVITETYSNSFVYNTLGIAQADSGFSALAGYIDDFRFTKSVALYTSNFTAPTAQFSDPMSKVINLIRTTPASYGISLACFSNGVIGAESPGRSRFIEGSIRPTINTWNHIALTRTGIWLKVFVNGVMSGSYEGTETYEQGALVISDSDTTKQFEGYIDNVRIIKGTSLYRENFVPPNNLPSKITDRYADNTYSISTDTPLKYGAASGGNACVWSPIDNGGLTLSKANLTASRSTASWAQVNGTFPMYESTWYWEVYIDTAATTISIGVTNIKVSKASLALTPLSNSYGYYYTSDGNKYITTVSSGYGETFTTGDTIGVSFNTTSGTLEMFKNGVSQGILSNTITTGETYVPVVAITGTGTISANFGQMPLRFSIPVNHRILQTGSLQNQSIINSKSYFDISTYSGNNSVQTISNIQFKPDLIWIKARNSSVQYHVVQDIVRGKNSGNYLPIFPNSYTAEDSATNRPRVTDINTDGFTMGNDIDVNGSGLTYVAWMWRSGSTPVTNTNGSISSNVSANPGAGISIVTYTGQGTATTIGHGLGVSPKMILLKNRTSGGIVHWFVYHINMDATAHGGRLLLNDPGAYAADVNAWNNTAPTSSVFSVGNSTYTNASTIGHVAYLFTNIPGFSKFSKYTGNGLADGPYIHLGFSPKYIMIKRIDGTASWYIIDTGRQPSNLNDTRLIINSAASEVSGDAVGFDLLSSGFKIKNANADFNATNGNYIYAAFAEVPFKYANAR